MPEISKITLPTGTTYDIKDATAREEIATIVGGNVVRFIGVSTTEITDGGSQTPTIAGWSDTIKAGDICFYGAAEFIWGNDSKWHETGDLSSLGALAYKNNATGTVTPTGTVTGSFTGSNTTFTGSFTPQGTVTGGTFTGTSGTYSGSFTPQGTVTVSTNQQKTVKANIKSQLEPDAGTDVAIPIITAVQKPTISVNSAGATTSIKNPTAVTVMKSMATAAPGATAPTNAITYFAVSSETLSLYQIGYDTGDSITTSNVTVKTGDATYAATSPSTTKMSFYLYGSVSVPSSYTASFAGSAATVNVSGTPSGSISEIGFSGSAATVTVSGTPSGTISATFSGSPVSITVE